MVEYDDDEAIRKTYKELENFNNKHKTNLNETKATNLGSNEEAKKI